MLSLDYLPLPLSDLQRLSASGVVLLGILAIVTLAFRYHDLPCSSHKVVFLPTAKSILIRAHLSCVISPLATAYEDVGFTRTAAGTLFAKASQGDSTSHKARTQFLAASATRNLGSAK